MLAEQHDKTKLKRDMDQHLRQLGHRIAPWTWAGELLCWVTLCPSCHCYPYMEPDGTCYGAPLGLHCRTLTAMYDHRLALNERERKGMQ